MTDQDEEPTCGRGLADSAAVPSALAAVAAGIAQNLEVHTRALDPGDPAAAQERHVYERVVGSSRICAIPAATAASADGTTALSARPRPQVGSSSSSVTFHSCRRSAGRSMRSPSS